MVGKPNLVKWFGPRLRLWTWTLDFVPGPNFSIDKFIYIIYEFTDCNEFNEFICFVNSTESTALYDLNSMIINYIK